MGGFPLLKKEHICQQKTARIVLLKGNQSFAIHAKTSKMSGCFVYCKHFFLKSHAKVPHINHKNPRGTNLFLYFLPLHSILSHSETPTHAAVKKDVPFSTKHSFFNTLICTFSCRCIVRLLRVC